MSAYDSRRRRGGNFETAALLAKKALLRPVGEYSKKPHLMEMEKGAFGEDKPSWHRPPGVLAEERTALWVSVESFPTHIAGMPVAVNISCHVTRHAEVVL